MCYIILPVLQPFIALLFYQYCNHSLLHYSTGVVTIHCVLLFYRSCNHSMSITLFYWYCNHSLCYVIPPVLQPFNGCVTLFYQYCKHSFCYISLQVLQPLIVTLFYRCCDHSFWYIILPVLQPFIVLHYFTGVVSIHCVILFYQHCKHSLSILCCLTDICNHSLSVTLFYRYYNISLSVLHYSTGIALQDTPINEHVWHWWLSAHFHYCHIQLIQTRQGNGRNIDKLSLPAHLANTNKINGWRTDAKAVLRLKAMFNIENYQSKCIAVKNHIPLDRYNQTWIVRNDIGSQNIHIYYQNVRM